MTTRRTKTIAGWAARSLLAAATACSVGPDYVRPAAPVPAAFKDAGLWKSAEPKDEIPRGAWWTIFRDPTLDALESKIDVSNQTLAMAEAQYRASLAAIGVSRAAFFPVVTANASVTRTNSSSNLRGGTIASAAGGTATGAIPGGSANTTIYSLPLNVSWEADVWGRIRRTVEASRATAQASAADLESARLSAHAALAQNYFQLRSLDAQKALLERAVSDFERVLAVTENRYLVGVAARSDVLQARQQVESTRAQAIDLEVTRAQTEDAIAVLVGTPASSFELRAGGLPASPPDVPLYWPSEVLERRPDVASAERRMAAANAQIGVAVAAYYPRLTLGATGGLTSTTLSNLFSTSSIFWSLGPALAATLFDGGARSALVAEARANYDATVANYRQTTLAAFQDVEDNLAALRYLRDESAVLSSAVQDARDAVSVVKNQYSAGTAAYTDLLVAETTALATERTNVDVFGRRMVATVLLVKALGGGWKAPDAGK
jgi:NodT family efflux transporter outer membrane factor (OMF) lipoprotein